MRHDECRDRFVELLYGDLDPATRAACEGHLRECDACASAYAALASTKQTMDFRKREDPSPEFWERHWAGVENRIAAPRTARAPLTWIYAAAAVLLVAAGVYLGRTVFTAGTPASVPALEARAAAAAPGGDSADVRAQAYLERSKVLLQGIINQEGETHSPGSYARQRRVSRELASEANVLTAALGRPEQRQVRELVEALQIILLQLANIEVRPGQPALELVRQGADHKSILFKIRLEELRAMSRRQPAAGNDSLHTHL